MSVETNYTNHYISKILNEEEKVIIKNGGKL